MIASAAHRRGATRTFPVLMMFTLLFILVASAAIADDAPLRVTAIDSMVVKATPHVLGNQTHSITTGQDINEILGISPFSLIRKGATCCSDLYAEGFKRTDITFTIDGERFETACPNRMDTRIGLVSLMNMEQVNLNRNSSELQGGLGGVVSFKRRMPAEPFRVYGQVGGTFDSVEAKDADVSIEGREMRLTVRHRESEAWVDGDDRTFEDMYGFKDAATHKITEVTTHKAWSVGDAMVAYEKTTDLLFPYLKMDERDNKHWRASASHKGHRFYFNRNEHLMDNGLRKSWTMMSRMITDATNTMFGVVGDNYEVYARNWDADNSITPTANPAMAKHNHLLPDVWRTYASYRHDFGRMMDTDVSVRVGVARTSIGDKDQLDLYRILQPDAETDILSIPFGVTVKRMIDVTDNVLAKLSAEVTSEPASIEAQSITVDKPGTTPDWIGNPELSDPVRASLRAGLKHKVFNFETFATKVWSYPTLTSASVDGANYLTYSGVDAMLYGASLFASWEYFDIGTSWNWGEKTDDSTPLAEIQPLLFSVAARTPRLDRFHGRALYQHSAEQDRVDESLSETATDGWDRLDLSIIGEFENATFHFEVENVLDETYSQHLSMWRDPFSANVKVFEPGRTFIAKVTFEI